MYHAEGQYRPYRLGGALWTTLRLALGRRICFPGELAGRTVRFEGDEWTVFREAVVGVRDQHGDGGSVFIARFHVAGMTVRQNIWFSWLPVPLLLGLPGFRSKLWMYNRAGDFQGIYEWESEDAAQRYAHSAAVRFMTNRSVLGSIAFRVIGRTRREALLEAM